ncbi:FAD-dependent monooxygenase [Streptomyces sp. NPDC047043]|uniref:FAD-dependent monooxygenase n=1 Tax=Streptomyces sp. NPDC047043 TaxID=3154497 RepID=UPI0033F156F2
MEIAIIGAGLGGLTTALRLQQQGFRPRVYESAVELRELGVGIVLQPYGARELDELGVLDAVKEVTVDALESTFYNQHGQRLYGERCGTHMGYSHPMRFCHRGVLQKVLIDAVTERLGPDAIVVGARCIGFEQDDEGVTVRFERRSSTVPEEVRADIAIGADGINSAIRHAMHPGRSGPRYSGVTMWRGVTLMKPYLAGGTILHIGAPSKGSIICYPIIDNAFGTDLTLVNWAIEEYGRPQMVEDWNQTADATEIAGMFPDWDADFIDITQMLRTARAAYVIPMMDHDPLPFWSDRRVTLLGDAAHALYPRGGNGLGQALLDAGALARKLGGGGDPIEALQGYENERREAANRVVIANRGEGPEIIRRLVEERTGGKRFDHIDDVLPSAEADAIFSEYHRLAGMTRPGQSAQDGGTGFFDEAQASKVRSIVGPAS